MARELHKLSALAIKSIKEVGRYADGGGLYFQVAQNGSRSWLFRFMINGRSREMGLGAIADVKLAAAREMASQYRLLSKEGVDPIEARKSDREALYQKLQSVKTFEECKAVYLKSHSPTWKNKKHIQQWENSLTNYASPILGSLDISKIDTSMVMRVLEPIWRSKTETANRVRGRIERILDWATVQGFRAGDNPARWKGHLSELLPAPSKLKKVKHMPALPYQEVSAFMKALKSKDSIGAKALSFLILTAGRSAEVRFATWSEIDLDKKAWTIPEERMKASKEHVVPLCDDVLAILRALPRMAGNEYLFPGMRSGKPLSDMTLTKILRDKDMAGVTVHGFRSSFRDWAGEQTSYPRNEIEYCLAHNLKDKVEAAYHRSNLLEKRRPIMQAWSDYCHRPVNEADNVVSIGKKA